MLLAMIPIISVSAAGDLVGPLKPVYTASTLESMAEPKEDDDDDSVSPLAGYYYDSKGFHMESPVYTKLHTPYSTIATTDSYDITQKNDSKGGHALSCKFVVDKFLYDGGMGADEWICLSITNQQSVNPGSAKYQDGWFLLIRGDGDGSAVFEPHLDFGPTFMASAGEFVKNGTAEIVDDKEVYEFALDFDGTDWIMTLNGADVSADSLIIGGEDQTSIFETFKDKAYFNISVQTGYVDDENPDSNKIELSVLEFNGEVPYGDDQAEPITDDATFADIADSSTVPANTPAVIWDSTMSSFKRFTGSSLEYTVNDDGTIHVVASHPSPYITWGINRKISYEAADFPYIAVLCKNVPTMSGNSYYCAGDVLSANPDVRMDWDPMEEDLGDDWTIGIIDVDGLWEGRIHNLRIGFDGIDYEDEDLNNWDIGFVGCFRSPEEAMNYARAYLANLGVEVVTEEAVTTSAEPTAVTTEADVVTTAAEVVTTGAGADTGADTAAGTGAEETTAEKKGGCGGVIGGIALIAVVSLAGVCIKKKDRKSVV